MPSLFSGDYDDLTNKPDLSIYLTGYTVTADDVTGITASLYAPIVHTHAYSAITDTPDLSVYQPVSCMSVYLTGVTWNDVTNKPDLTLQSDFTGHTSDLTIHYPQSGISITESQISDLQDYALQSDFTGHTSDLTIHYPQSGISITESQISDLQAYALQSAINAYTGTTAPASFLPITGLTGYWTSAQTENYVTGLGYLTGVTSVGSGTTVLKTASEIKSLTATNLTLNAQTNEVNIEAGSIAPKNFWTGTEAQYLALGSYDSNTLYFCTA